MGEPLGRQPGTRCHPRLAAGRLTRSVPHAGPPNCGTIDGPERLSPPPKTGSPVAPRSHWWRLTSHCGVRGSPGMWQMDDSEWLAQRFEEHRAHLRAVAYRMLGSLSEADDAVQDAWLRLSRAGAGEIETLGGWLTTVVARVCLNVLRSRTTRREDPLGAQVPGPIVSLGGGVGPG